VVFINDLADVSVIKSWKKLYADDSKLFAPVDSSPAPHSLQEDLDRVASWCQTWLMELNAEKCKVMHFGRNNPHVEYQITKGDGQHRLETTSVERDLGVLMSSDLSWTPQVEEVASKASRMLGLLKNTFRSRDAQLWKCLYSSYVRPLLEFAVPVWSPVLERDIRALERIQRRATRIPHTMRGVEYEDRCAQLGICTLIDRRRRGDMITAYKQTHGIETVRWYSEPLRTAARAGKREQWRREVAPALLQARHHFFTNRAAGPWNELPNKIVDAPSVNSFKAQYDKLMQA
jgi:hypothetical protein